jgi:hypothetical protein
MSLLRVTDSIALEIISIVADSEDQTQPIKSSRRTAEIVAGVTHRCIESSSMNARGMKNG